MIATAHYPPSNARAAGSQPQPGQNVLLMSHDPAEADRFCTHLPVIRLIPRQDSEARPAIGARENQAFASRLSEFISANLHDAGLDVDGLARMMNTSRATLYRRIRYVSGRTPHGLINFMRLKKAAELLSAGELKVFEVGRSVGFYSRSNFSRAFVKQFGLTPKEYGQAAAGLAFLRNPLH